VTSPEEFQRTASQWILDFLSIPMQGHSKANVTPYMHMLAVHVSEQIDLYGDIRRFTGQGVEKNNDTDRRNYFSSNHLDVSKTILTTESRTADLSDHKRNKRGYIKRNEQYWESDIYAKRRRTL
jgi:hypothetical protein